MKILIYALLATFFVGCTSPARFTSKAMTRYDKDTDFVIEERKDGFGITIEYSRYQFIPESSAIATACKSQLTAIAWEYSDRAGRTIEQINEQRIRISMGRNALTGLNYCSAHAIAKWKQ